MPLLEIKNITKTFGEGSSLIKAIDDITFEAKRRDYITFMGPSGAGKSTLINILAGIDSPTMGTVYINGKDFSSLSDSDKCDIRRHQIGIIFQFYNLHPNLSVSENIELPLIIAGVSKKERPEKIKRVLTLAHIEHRSNHYPFELSGGEQQRTAIARALVMNPLLLLCDELTGDLDSETGNQIIELLHKLNKDENVTILMVTHDESMLRIGDRLIQMEDGKITSDLTIEREDQLPKYDFLS